MKRRPPNFARAIIKVGNGILREKRCLRQQTIKRLPKLTHTEICAVHDLVATMVRLRGGIGPRNRRFMTRRKP